MLVRCIGSVNAKCGRFVKTNYYEERIERKAITKESWFYNRPVYLVSIWSFAYLIETIIYLCTFVPIILGVVNCFTHTVKFNFLSCETLPQLYFASIVSGFFCSLAWCLVCACMYDITIDGPIEVITECFEVNKYYVKVSDRKAKNIEAKLERDNTKRLKEQERNDIIRLLRSRSI